MVKIFTEFRRISLNLPSKTIGNITKPKTSIVTQKTFYDK